ncbi:MAG: hypothetical protein EA382_18135 [Spirochaetaceae bacterium]|nr:MAG: hypothetical protein EA382_18135 [Spirochaetaceae bacterium]
MQQPNLILRSGDLSIEIARPGSRDEHHATRFSPVAYILQARYRDHTYFFDRGSPMEFDIGERTTPPGYALSPPGGCFTKIGVGRLERPTADPYKLGSTYPIRVRPETTVEAESSRAAFHQLLETDEQAPGYELAVHLAVDGNTLTIDYALRNLGETTFVTEQYLHNFSRLDDAALSADYRVSLDYDCEICDSLGAQLDPPQTALIRPDGSRAFTFDVSVAQERAKLFFRPTGTPARQRWSVENRATGTGMTIEADRPPQVSALWATRDQVSPEMNVTLTIEPGATARWSRRYEFR